jgi:hypothetical protein
MSHFQFTEVPLEVFIVIIKVWLAMVQYVVCLLLNKQKYVLKLGGECLDALDFRLLQHRE